MRIAQIAPIIESVPPEKYGGTERVISALTEGIVKKGHEVTLFASGDSQTSAKLFSVFPTALRKANVENVYGSNIWSLLNVGLAYQLQSQFDIIHDHNSQNNPISLPIANTAQIPVVMTLHGPIDYAYSKTFSFYTKPHLVSISHKQRASFPNLNYIGNVYHGLAMENYPFGTATDGYLLFVGRVHRENGIEEKGLLHAIIIAETLHMPLLIAAKLDMSVKEDVAYFLQVIKPRLSDSIKWLGEVDETLRNKLMSRAVCLIHSVNFPEPFGLTLIEAMACGCPVVAFGKGSIPEIIQQGRSGYVVQTREEAIAAIQCIAQISRDYCRSYALEHFSAARMVTEYEKMYQKAIKLHHPAVGKKRFTQYSDILVKKLVKTLQKL